MGESFETIRSACREAALGDLRFDELVGKMASFVGGDKAMLLGRTQRDAYAVNIAAGHDPDALSAYKDHWYRHDPRRFQSLSTPVGAVTLGQDYLSNEKIARSDYYEAVAVAGDVKDSVHGIIEDDGRGARMAISIHRGFGEEFFSAREADRLGAILPLVRQALDDSRRIALLSGSGDPERVLGWWLVDARLTVLHAGMDAPCDDVPLVSRRGHLEGASPARTDALALAVAAASAGRRITLSGERYDLDIARPPAAIDWMTGTEPSAMIVLRHRDDDGARTASACFAAAHGFTGRERDLLTCLMAHERLADAASAAGMRTETARWHLKNMMGKSAFASRAAMLDAVRQGSWLDRP